jgi:HSP20 family protein
MLTIKSSIHPTIKHFFDAFDEIFEPVIDFDDLIKHPLHNTIENDSEYILELQLAGIKKEDINIDAEKDKLVIKAERKENKDYKYNKKQILHGKYEKIFILPDYVDMENIKASFIDGILLITIPKIINEKILNKKKIEIK